MSNLVKTDKKEQISAFIDAELNEGELNAFLESECIHNGSTWVEYHLIGDILRSDDLADDLSQEFTKKIQAQLSDEPVYLLPEARKTVAPEQNWVNWGGLAAMVALAYFAMPFLLTHTPSKDSTIAASSDKQIYEVKGYGSGVVIANTEAEFVAGQSKQDSQQEYEMLRDPKLDSYLTAHQRYSPQLNLSTAKHKTNQELSAVKK